MRRGDILPTLDCTSTFWKDVSANPSSFQRTQIIDKFGDTISALGFACCGPIGEGTALPDMRGSVETDSLNARDRYSGEPVLVGALAHAWQGLASACAATVGQRNISCSAAQAYEMCENTWQVIRQALPTSTLTSVCLSLCRDRYLRIPLPRAAAPAPKAVAEKPAARAAAGRPLPKYRHLPERQDRSPPPSRRSWREESEPSRVTERERDLERREREVFRERERDLDRREADLARELPARRRPAPAPAPKSVSFTAKVRPGSEGYDHEADQCPMYAVPLRPGLPSCVPARRPARERVPFHPCGTVTACRVASQPRWVVELLVRLLQGVAGQEPVPQLPLRVLPPARRAQGAPRGAAG